MHTIRAYGGLEIKLHTSLTSALNGGEGVSPPHPATLRLGKEPLVLTE